MRFNNRKTNSKSQRVAGTIRQTQLITTFGCGSIVDLKNDSVIIAGTDYWKNYDNDDYKIWEYNLQKLLGVDYFIKPKVDEIKSNLPYKTSRDIPVFRFPETLICTKCNKISNYKKFKYGRNLKCNKCGSKNLVPSRFVAACENGHLEEFPYGWWVHFGDEDTCINHDLYRINNKDSGGLESVIIYCKSCGKARSMKGSFSSEALKGCSGNRPWLRDHDNDLCDKPLRTAQRGGTNLYFAIHSSALSIPPWSDKIHAELDKSWSFISGLNPTDNVFINSLIDHKRIHEKCQCSKEEVKKQIILRLKKETDSSKKTEQEIMEDEYKAFINGDNDGEYFITRNGLIPEFLKGYIDNIILVPKLREILALKGFRRIKPQKNLDNDTNGIAPLSRNTKNWLPAIELNGEGIFIKLNEEKLKEWESEESIINRAKILENNMDIAEFANNKFSPRYILLHTLSHLIIRQLVLQCGYSTSAIKEKIYSTFNNNEDSIDMAGILIYTATPDSEGSLGGLVNEGRLNKIENTFRNLLESASWCSSDPLCITSKGQGLYSLNLAACHSCTLLPETSCEMRNLFLDRATIIGTLENKEIGYFSSLLTGRDD